MFVWRVAGLGCVSHRKRYASLGFAMCVFAVAVFVLVTFEIPMDGNATPSRRISSPLLKRNTTKWNSTLDEFCGVKFSPIHDILKKKPIKPLSNVKNPCMFRPDGKGFLCGPYFYLVGAPKCGTTDLYVQLRKHPEFVAPREKEPHWLSRKLFHYGMTYETYLDYYYSTASQQIYQDFLQHQNATSGNFSSSLITGDASATYFYDNDFWPILPGNVNTDEPLLTNADFIYHLNPTAKILITLRNPIERLWSDFLAASTTPHKTPEVFHQMVVRALVLFRTCFKTRSVRSCVHDKHLHLESTTTDEFKGEHVLPWMKHVWMACPTLFQANVDIRVGLYSVFLKDYLRVFPRQQIYIHRLEDYASDEVATMKSVFEFLDMSTPQRLLMSLKDNAVANKRKANETRIGDMWKETRRILYDFYKPFNEELADIFKDQAYNYGKN